MSPGKPGAVTRSNSKAPESLSPTDQLKAKLKFYRRKLDTLIPQVNDQDISSNWTKNDIIERLRQLNNWNKEHERVIIEANCEIDPNNLADFEDDEEFNNRVTAARVGLNNRLDEINAPVVIQNGNAPQTKIKLKSKFSKRMQLETSQTYGENSMAIIQNGNRSMTNGSHLCTKTMRLRQS